jgi:hypothetical protein
MKTSAKPMVFGNVNITPDPEKNHKKSPSFD